MNKIVSIIVPLYNSSKFISDTFRSVLSQTYSDWELLLVDDFSTDDTVEVVNALIKDESRARLIQMDSNVGKANCINRALDEACGRYIAFLDSDDVWMKTKLEKQIAFMVERDIPISCTAFQHFSNSNGALGRVYHAKEKVDYKRVLLDCPVGNSTVIYDVDKLGKQPVPDIRKRMDDALWLKILKVTPYIWGLDEILMRYRVREDSMSRNKLALVKYHWILYREIEHLSIVSSLLHIGYWGLIKSIGIK